jgi:hypothetical protein
LNDWGASYFALEAKPPVVKQIWLSHLPINLTSGDDCSPPYRVLGSMKRLAALAPVLGRFRGGPDMRRRPAPTRGDADDPIRTCWPCGDALMMRPRWT